MTDAVMLRMVIPFFSVWEPGKLFSNFGEGLVLLWPFGETNAAAMRCPRDPKRRASIGPGFVP
jgi:hypothetical protein